jgi:hypothetical protein
MMGSGDFAGSGTPGRRRAVALAGASVLAAVGVALAACGSGRTAVPTRPIPVYTVPTLDRPPALPSIPYFTLDPSEIQSFRDHLYTPNPCIAAIIASPSSPPSQCRVKDSTGN